jgi:hypothetical protein
MFTGTQNAVWIGMLVYVFARGAAATACAVAVLQLVPAALVALVAASLADQRTPSGMLTAGYLVQVLGMLVQRWADAQAGGTR